MILIGISGRMGVGKSTLARILAGKLGGEVYSFADALREEVAESYGYSMDKLREKPTPEGIRKLLQCHGTDIRRAQDAAYWTKKMATRLISSRAPVVIIDDVRFLNEAALVVAFGGAMAHLHPYQGWREQSGAEHRSEGLETILGLWSWDLHPEYGELGSAADEILDGMAGECLPSIASVSPEVDTALYFELTES